MPSMTDSSHTGFVVLIPARRASTRLPNKMLVDLGGIPLVVHAANRARQSEAEEVWVATDDEEIAQTVKKYGYTPIMTNPQHLSGTDRIAEAVKKLELPSSMRVVNVQGDEPFMPPQWIDAVARVLDSQKECVMSSACYRITDPLEIFNPNIVKVVQDVKGRALYFSRAPIPWARSDFNLSAPPVLPAHTPIYRHVGLYAYRVDFLQKYHQLPVGVLESCESLEQLRVLEQGYPIALFTGQDSLPPGIDTEEDLHTARLYWEQMQKSTEKVK